MQPEDKILDKAVELASSNQLSTEDLISIVKESTGVSQETARKAVELAKKSENRQSLKTQKSSINYQKSTSTDSTETEFDSKFLIMSIAGLAQIIVAFYFIAPILIGDRPLLDVLQNQEETLK